MSERGKFEMWAKDFYPLDMDADPETGATDYLEGDTLAAWCGWQAAKAESAAELAALRAELEEARKDAERYRWLKANCATRTHPSIPIQLIAQESWSSRFNGYRQHLDAAIDVAKEQGK